MSKKKFGLKDITLAVTSCVVNAYIRDVNPNDPYKREKQNAAHQFLKDLLGEYDVDKQVEIQMLAHVAFDATADVLATIEQEIDEKYGVTKEEQA